MEWVDRGTTASRGAVFVRIGVLALFAVLPVVLAGSASAAQAPAGCEHPVARFESVTNTVRLVRASTQAGAAARQALVCAGDVVRVGDNSRAVILILASNTPIAIDSNSEFIVADPPAPDRTLITLLRGALLYISRVRRSLAIQTPFVNASTEGTEFLVRVGEESAVITVLEGSVRASNEFGSLLVAAGQQAVTRRGRAPELEVVVRPRDAVRWALYYEPVLPVDTSAELEKVPEDKRDSKFHVRRAALALSAGQLPEARSDIELALKLDASNAEAYALQAVVAVALNDKEAALKAGGAAVERSPRSAAALVAYSYALQANFQLEAARDRVMQAVQAQPDDATAWARLAELRLMVDDVRGARTAGQRAATLAPRLPRTQVVLGFTSLAELKLSDAERAFNEAIDLQPENPLGRLGLGLVKIRRGRLSEGRQDLELAVALNPDNPVIRSYLGKAYFDEKREDLAGQQLDAARALDRLDPTPWFYDAIRKQTLNRPIEALHDLQRSIELNDNRAIYRSHADLEGDRAARGAALARIYRDLGFEQVALLEGWKSLVTDPASHSSHRFLADAYVGLPRHTIARDSELLQAQLLQPTNVTPVQPRLADNGLVFLDLGIAPVGYSEYTRLFAGNQIRFVGDGLVGERGTFADNLILSGILNRFSYSVGQFHTQTDGIRKNDDARENIYDVFAQAELTASTGAQIELRMSDSDLGDRRMLFDPTNYLDRLRSVGDTDSVRIGARHRFGPGSVLIGSYAHRVLDSDFDTGVGLRVKTDETADFAEIRYLHEWRRANLTGGLGYYTGDRVEERSFGPFQFPPETTDVRHSNSYVYIDITPARAVTVTGGISTNDFRSGELKRSPVSPKLGMIWLVDAATTVRAAAFRTLERTLISSQTLEPTQVAGFNQFFYDVSGTDSRRYGIALDRRLTGSVFGGVELSLRELRVPTFDAASGRLTDTDRQERAVRAYVHATPTSYLVLSSQYQFDRLTRDPEGNNEGLLANTRVHRLSGESRVFLRAGGFGRVRVTFVDQEGRFQDPRQIVVSGADRFCMLDASIGYRLPRQRGIFSIDGRNALDTAFRFQDSSPEEPTIVPARQVTARLTLAF
jgi:tetratricopeptide (TPR) repeat protein